MFFLFIFKLTLDNKELNEPTTSYPTRRSSDLVNNDTVSSLSDVARTEHGLQNLKVGGLHERHLEGVRVVGLRRCDNVSAVVLHLRDIAALGLGDTSIGIGRSHV